MNRWILNIFLLIWTWKTEVLALSSGAPSDACPDFIPRHRETSPATSYPPYEIRPVIGASRLRITLGSPQGLPFKGFIINARDVETQEVIGNFENIPDGARAIACLSDFNNTVTHSNSNDKHNLDLEWVYPEDYEGTVIFNSTFLQDYSTYWVGVESPRITIFKDTVQLITSPTSTTPSTTPQLTSAKVPSYYEINRKNVKNNIPQHPIYERCGSTKNCFANTDDCLDDGSCKAVVGVEVKGERYIFELFSTSGSYVAVGLSRDNKMGEDSVVECIKRNDQISIHMSWNSGKSNRRITTPSGALSLEKSSADNGTIYCKFVRDKVTTVQGVEFDLFNEKYYLLLAAGSELEPNGWVGFHDIIYVASGQEKKLSDVGKIAAASDIFIRVHGALMIISWIGTASVGMLLARYYKQTWRKSQICGKDQWFAWHRFFMLLTWLMTLVSFVLIFLQVGGWSSETIHASLGLATTVLAFIQPFLAAARPHPGTPRRPLFNWVHWLIGNAAHICGIVALFFAVRLNKAKIPEWVDWILTAYVAFHVIVHIILSIGGCVADKKYHHSVDAFPLKDMHMRGPEIHSDIKRDAPLGGLRKLTFGIYFIFVAVFATALTLITVLSPIEESWTMFIKKIKSL